MLKELLFEYYFFTDTKNNNENICYTGEFLDNNKNGVGTEKHNNYILYEGQWSNNNKNGYGKLYYNDSDKVFFDGTFIKNKKNGLGKMFYNNGDVKINGTWKNDLLINGIEFWENSNFKYQGCFTPFNI